MLIVLYIQPLHAMCKLQYRMAKKFGQIHFGGLLKLLQLHLPEFTLVVVQGFVIMILVSKFANPKRVSNNDET